MATKLFPRELVADTHLGAQMSTLASGLAGISALALSTTQGSGGSFSVFMPTVAGPTGGIELKNTGTTTLAVTGTTPLFVSPPVAADVTISGTITANVWANENAMADNVAVNVWIGIIRANALGTNSGNTIVEIVRSTNAAELGTSHAAVNFTTGMTSGGYTSQTLNRGDRLCIRIFGDDGGGTMATPGPFNYTFNGAAGISGDSYVSFTENITFENAPGSLATQSDHSSSEPVGSVSYVQQAQPFVATATTTLTEVKLWHSKVGAPADDLIVEVQTNSAGAPSGSVVGTVATVSAASLTTTLTEYTYSCSVALTASTTYWLVLRRSGSLDAANYCQVGTTSSGVIPAGWSTRLLFNSWAWGTASGTRVFTVTLSSATFTVYLTDTASAVSTASVDREAWTSRGAGVQTDVRNTAAGWTAPLQLTDTAGGTVVDWFTRPLTAFTLTGMAVANIRAASSSASANDSIRCEIARVEGDGTSPTVWSSWCIAPTGTDNGELATSEVARTCNVSGDDLAITNGQRLRIRLYTDDMSAAAMAASFTTTVYYAGTSAAASGDTYITFPQTLTEYASGPFTYTKAGWSVVEGDGYGISVRIGGAAAGPSFRRQRRAERHLTIR